LAFFGRHGFDLRKSLEEELIQAQLALEELRDERILAVRIRKLDADLERKTKELFSLKNHDRLLNQIKDNAMLQNVVSKDIERLEAEKEKLLIDNDRQQKKLEAKINLLQEKIQKTKNDHLRKIDQRKQEISVLEAKLANIKETRVLREPMQSLEETGLGAGMILALAGFAGLIAGLLAVFFAEFLARVKERRQELQEA